MLRKRNKIEAGLFGFQQVVPIRTYFLYHNLKKKPYEKTCFHSLKLGCTIFSWAIFLVRNRQSSETRFFSRILVGHHFEFWDRPKRKLESADVAESDKNVDGAKKDDIFGSVISVWQRKNWERWGPHKVAGRCRLRKCPPTHLVFILTVLSDLREFRLFGLTSSLVSFDCTINNKLYRNLLGRRWLQTSASIFEKFTPILFFGRRLHSTSNLSRRSKVVRYRRYEA